MKESPPLSNQEYVELLEAQRYDEILLHCQGYIKQKVASYLRNFQYYYQFDDDFYHEVCIHILTKSLPSSAFLEACQNGNSFKFYLAKSVRNILNTLLTREKNKRKSWVAIEQLQPHQEEDFQHDRSLSFSDEASREQTDFQDILSHIRERFDQFLENFKEAFPKIAYKLILLLKLQARATIQIEDVVYCFEGMKKRDIQNFLQLLGEDQVYRQREDKEIYELIHPFFQSYRQEKGSPAALQRWLNQHITGDRHRRGILDYLEIRDRDMNFKIQNKKRFADFLHVYFKYKEEQAQAETIEAEHIWGKRPQPNWATAISSR